jgi:hypothetical protein
LCDPDTRFDQTHRPATHRKDRDCPSSDRT